MLVDYLQTSKNDICQKGSTIQTGDTEVAWVFGGFTVYCLIYERVETTNLTNEKKKKIKSRINAFLIIKNFPDNLAMIKKMGTRRVRWIRYEFELTKQPLPPKLRSSLPFFYGAGTLENYVSNTRICFLFTAKSYTNVLIIQWSSVFPPQIRINTQALQL